MMDCAQVAKKLLEYLDRELCQGDMASLEQHIEDCRACFNHVEFEKLLRTHLQQATDHKCSEHLRKRVHDIIDKY